MYFYFPGHYINCILSRFQILSSSPDNPNTSNTELSTAALASFNNFMASDPSEGVKSFLDLPQELRLQIYRLLLVHHDDLYFHPAYSFYHCTHKLYPHVLRTCRLIYAEAAPVLYSENKLVIDSARSMSRLRQMFFHMPSVFRPEESVRQIRSLTLLGWCPLPRFLVDAETAAFQISHLRSLSIKLDGIIVGQALAPVQTDFVPFKSRRELRRYILRSFSNFTNRRHHLWRFVEVNYEQDINKPEDTHGMHFQLLRRGMPTLAASAVTDRAGERRGSR